MADFIKGMDISTYAELEKLGAKYYDNGVEREVLDILKDYGTNAVRIRVWVNPYSEKGESYGAGCNDLETSVYIAQKCKAKGFDFLLDIHYSDFWTDPGKQIMPKAWVGLDDDELKQKMYDYTIEVLEAFKEADAYPTMIQVGNELTNGLLWPNGRKAEADAPQEEYERQFDRIAMFISAGIRGVHYMNGVIAKETGKTDYKLPIMIHLDNGGNNELYRDWFDHYIPRGEDFDVIGLSYYPFWHGSLDALEQNMNDIAERYGKELIVAEVSMGFTMEDYASYEKLSPQERKGMATKPELVEKIDYPMTKQGQKEFMEDIMNRIKNVKDNLGKGFYYWEPAWIPVPGSAWATPASLAYMNDVGPCGNEWANQVLFDYEGNVNPALEAIRDFK
jgi:arabinogalactan endo-1,4-beta-galactosidase